MMDKERASPSDDSGYTNSALEYISQALMEDDMEERTCMFYDTLALQATEKSLYDVLGDDQVLGSSVSDIVVPNCFLQSECALQFNRGVQEASKFLPKLNHLTTALEKKPASANELREMISETDVRPGLEEREFALSRVMGKKNREKRDTQELEGNRKRSAVSVDENEILELFDKLLLYSSIEPPPPRIRDLCLQQRATKTSEQKEQTTRSLGGKAQIMEEQDNEEAIDLRTLLLSCARALSSNDVKTFNEHLKLIRQHSSSSGDGNQRLSHVFANALEARLAGTGTKIYTALSSKRKSTAEILKAHQLLLSAIPFQRSATFFANRSILEYFVKETKATTLHIIDFGISYGLQWPPLIVRLLHLHGGHPKLRITGIDLPACIFRPTEVVQDTGRRLARYCERFNVPFEYNGIAQKWETIRVEDLKLRPNEVVAVNCLYRFQTLLDDTVMVNNPRDNVLKLIREINPDMFIHSIVNASHKSPFFLARFRDVLFHYSALFDMFDSNIPREDEMRLVFEQEIFGMEVMNIVACEGTERVERPESYKQWQDRTARAGFKQRDLDPVMLNKLRGWMKDEFQFHDNFSVETDGQWMLQGWKGRILFASSIWMPV